MPVSRILIIAAITALPFATSATAQTTDCRFDEGFCVPFVGCSETTGAYYVGRSYGQRSGPVAAISNTGRVCQGRWWRNALGIGRARFTCDDGAEGEARYTYFDSRSGTATGKGWTNRNEKLRFWAGHHVLSYVLANEGETKDLTACVQDALKAARP